MIRRKLRRNHPEQQIELGENPEAETSPSADTQLDAVRVDIQANTNSASGVIQRPLSSSGSAGDPQSEATPAAVVRSQENASLYSVKVGLLLFGFFIVSFIVIMVLRGVLNDAPILFRFFANIYLAGKAPSHPTRRLTLQEPSFLVMKSLPMYC
jgi:hypothetical protein